MTDETEKPFGGFHLAPFRTFWIDLDKLTLSICYSCDLYSEDDDKNSPLIADPVLSGTGDLSKDGLVRIGSEGSSGKIQVSVRAKSGMSGPTQRTSVGDDMRLIIQTEEDQNEPPDSFRSRRIREKLQVRPADAFLSFSKADWEIGNSDEWWCSIYLDDDVFKALSDAVARSESHDIRMGIRWVMGLINDPHPIPAFGVTWGLWSERPYGVERPEMLRGHVSSVGWKHALECQTSDHSDRPDQTTDDTRSGDAVTAEALQELVSRLERSGDKLRGRITTITAILILVIIVTSAFS